MMAQGLGHLDDRLFWACAAFSYAGGLLTLYVAVRLLQEEIWYRRYVRHLGAHW